MPTSPSHVTPRLRLLPLLALALICALLVRHARCPPASRDASTPATAFAAARAMRYLGVIAQRPHPIGSTDAARVRAYLLATLDSLGIAPEVQEVTAVGTRYQALGHVRNIVGRLHGTTPGGQAVMLMSHYDGVPAGPAASDAGSGVSVILEVLRALKAGPPLTHDVIVLFSDGEEAGLLGASAFVREHRFAKDVAVTLNFEARGTGGRASMFETGPGNLDLVRLLRDTPDVSASSLVVTIYRTLNNDTDLSEVALLGKPALNFAFVDDVARYHTTEDDTLHIDPGSMQQEGTQALTVVRALGAGPLPRLVTRDAVFSDLYPVGVVYYSQSVVRGVAIALAIAFLIATVLVSRREPRWLRDTTSGAVTTIVAMAVAGGLTAGIGAIVTHVHASVGGSPEFAGIYAIAMVAFALAGALGCWSLARRWCRTFGLHHGVLLVWTGLAVFTSFTLPGASFVVVWPLAVALLASLAHGAGPIVRSVTSVFAAYVALAVLVPMIATFGPVLLGVIGPGGIATGVLVAFLAGIVAPQLEALMPTRTHLLAIASAVMGVAAVGVGLATLRTSAEHPVGSRVAYVADADSGDAWIAVPASTARDGSWAAAMLGPTMRLSAPGQARDTSSMPVWLPDALRWGRALAGRPVPAVALRGPTAVVLRDTVSSVGRELTLRIMAPSGALSASLRVSGRGVRRAVVDGRVIDTTRFRRFSDDWAFSFSAPPDSGFVLAFTIVPATTTEIELTSMMAGLPAMPGVTIPARTRGTIINQTGDVTLLRRRYNF